MLIGKKEWSRGIGIFGESLEKLADQVEEVKAELLGTGKVGCAGQGTLDRVKATVGQFIRSWRY